MSQYQGAAPLGGSPPREHFIVGVLVKELGYAQTWARIEELAQALWNVRRVAAQMQQEQSLLQQRAVSPPPSPMVSPQEPSFTSVMRNEPATYPFPPFYQGQPAGGRLYDWERDAEFEAEREGARG